MSSSPPLVVADRYRLVAPLGQGGMGRVWRAVDVVLHRDVAIKELVPPPGLTVDERREMRERSLREARAIARLNNINVVRVFDVLRTDADPWIVMEYVPSRSLQDILASDGPFPAVRAAEMGLGMLNALRAAHRAGVVHRDVKPGNVLLGEDGRVVLTDFGLATVPGDPNVTRTGLVLGSPAYIAPERARDGTAGPAADLWSLGATLYAAVEGQSPFARSSAIATLAALATENPPPARNAGPLKPVLNGLLRKDPSHRINADEAERLLLRATGRRSKLSFPMSPTMRRPGAGRDRSAPSFGPPVVPGTGFTATGSAPVVPGPRPPVSPARPPMSPARPPASPGQPPVSPALPPASPGRPPVTPGRAPVTPAADGRPVFTPGKATVGRRQMPDTPTRIDQPKAAGPRLDATRVDTPPVRDGGRPGRTSSGTATPPPPPAGSAPPGTGPAADETIRGSRSGAALTADQIAAHRRRAAARIEMPAPPRPGGETAVPAAPRPSGAETAVPAAPRPGGGETAAPPAPPRSAGGETAVPTPPRPVGEIEPVGDIEPSPPADRAEPGQESETAAPQGDAGASAEVAQPEHEGQTEASTHQPEVHSDAADATDTEAADAIEATAEAQTAKAATAGTHPATAGTHPATAGTHPATAGTHPATAGTQPAKAQAVKAQPAKAEAQAAKAETQPAKTQAAKAETQPAKAETQAAKTQTAKAQAQSKPDSPGGTNAAGSAAPASRRSQAAENPQAASGNTNVAGGKTELIAVDGPTKPEGDEGQTAPSADESAPAQPAADPRPSATKPKTGAKPTVGVRAGAGSSSKASRKKARGRNTATAKTGTASTSPAGTPSPGTAKASATSDPTPGSTVEGGGTEAAAPATAARDGAQKSSATAAAGSTPTTNATSTTPTPATASGKNRNAAETKPSTAPTGQAPAAGAAEAGDAVSTAAAPDRGARAAGTGAPVGEAPAQTGPESGDLTEASQSAGPAAAASAGADRDLTTKVAPAPSTVGVPLARPATDHPGSAGRTGIGRRGRTTAAGVDATKLLAQGGSGAGRSFGGASAGSGRPAWQPMPVRDPSSGRRGVTVFGTTLTRRQTAIGVAILLALVLVLVLIVRMAAGGGDANKATGDAHKAGNTPSAAASAPAVPAPTPSQPAASAPQPPATKPSAPQTSAPQTNAALPAGWRVYRDRSGFSIPLPGDADISHPGRELHVRWDNRLLIIDQTDQPQPDPLADSKEQEQARRNSKYRDYDPVRLEAVKYFYKAADWEFFYTTSSNNRQHVWKRNFLSSPDQAYSIGMYAVPEDWGSASQEMQIMLKGFKPAS
ncbi:serine/threonine protein kinase [Krasilnikovia cinnamomea]|uniref:Serine/threonine protein kinase n=1 Tax=Krasilnikovia cinnamomea TaxID=349313 RepID=A0A4Q7ZJ26_9ACTN|nr:serine/threonine protein kinase [Krasilnikovia cinnamomea]